MPPSPVILRATFAPPQPSVGDMVTYVTSANAGLVSFVLPDYTGPYHTSAAKCGKVNAAQLSDYSAGGYVLGLLSHPQNQVLDTSHSVSAAASDCGSVFITYPLGAIVTLAGPGVNTAVHYDESTAAVTPVYYLWDGSKNNFVVRATGDRYHVPNAGGNTVSGDDLFLIEAFTDGQGRRVFMLYGFSWQGTLAAGVFFDSFVYPHPSQFPNSWYIYRWMDASSGTSANKFPDPGDVYTFLNSTTQTPPSLTLTSVPADGNRLLWFCWNRDGCVRGLSVRCVLRSTGLYGSLSYGKGEVWGEERCVIVRLFGGRVTYSALTVTSRMKF